MRFARGDLRDHIVSYQNDYRPSYWLQRALRLQESLKIGFREIFGVIRFSTFATISAQLRHCALRGKAGNAAGLVCRSNALPKRRSLDPERLIENG